MNGLPSTVLGGVRAGLVVEAQAQVQGQPVPGEGVGQVARTWSRPRPWRTARGGSGRGWRSGCSGSGCRRRGRCRVLVESDPAPAAAEAQLVAAAEAVGEVRALAVERVLRPQEQPLVRGAARLAADVVHDELAVHAALGHEPEALVVVGGLQVEEEAGAEDVVPLQLAEAGRVRRSWRRPGSRACPRGPGPPATAPARPIFVLAPRNQKALTMSDWPACQFSLAL